MTRRPARHVAAWKPAPAGWHLARIQAELQSIREELEALRGLVARDVAPAPMLADLMRDAMAAQPNANKR